MGLVIKVIKFAAYNDWSCVYFVQTLDEQKAKEKAFKIFKQTMECYLPDTLEEATKDDCFLIEVLAEVEQIIL